MSVIEAKNISYTYDENIKDRISLKDISLQIEAGECIGILGHNGCGKSTLAKHLNALITLQTGELTVAGLDARFHKNIWNIRKNCGMVFQNPDNQFVSTVIEEDIRFGLKNFEVPKEEMDIRIREALELVGMSGFEKRSTHFLSGGQKQRIAIAGVLAIKPDIIIFDEATSMLDPSGRQDVLQIISKLKSAGKTILIITHYIEELVDCDKVILVNQGEIKKIGRPETILTDETLLKEARILPSFPVRAYYDLQKLGIYLPSCPLTKEALVEAICQFD